VRQLFDPEQNVLAGVRYLRFLLDRFKNNLELALAGYNAGENAVSARGGVPPYAETRAYLQRLRTVYGKLGVAPILGSGYIYPTLDARGRLVYVNE
jgi:soluble lytic murein transglycosylase-like protein